MLWLMTHIQQTRPQFLLAQCSGPIILTRCAVIFFWAHKYYVARTISSEVGGVAYTKSNTYPRPSIRDWNKYMKTYIRFSLSSFHKKILIIVMVHQIKIKHLTLSRYINELRNDRFEERDLYFLTASSTYSFDWGPIINSSKYWHVFKEQISQQIFSRSILLI